MARKKIQKRKRLSSIRQDAVERKQRKQRRLSERKKIGSRLTIRSAQKTKIVVRHKSKKTTLPTGTRDKKSPLPVQSRNPDELTVHHLIPSSRGGTNDSWNKKKIPNKIHEAWHRLFINRKPREIVTVLRALEEKMGLGGGKEFFICVNREPNEVAWRLIFKNADIQEAIRIIKSDWSPHPPTGPTEPTTPKDDIDNLTFKGAGNDQIAGGATSSALEQED